jgi:hypothetical protein
MQENKLTCPSLYRFPFSSLRPAPLDLAPAPSLSWPGGPAGSTKQRIVSRTSRAHGGIDQADPIVPFGRMLFLDGVLFSSTRWCSRATRPVVPTNTSARRGISPHPLFVPFLFLPAYDDRRKRQTHRGRGLGERTRGTPKVRSTVTSTQVPQHAATGANHQSATLRATLPGKTRGITSYLYQHHIFTLTLALGGHSTVNERPDSLSPHCPPGKRSVLRYRQSADHFWPFRQCLESNQQRGASSAFSYGQGYVFYLSAREKRMAERNDKRKSI